MKARIQQFFIGRNGMDHLTRFLSIVSLILLVLGTFTFRFLSAIGIAVYICSLYRMLSRNLYKRREENQAYLQLTGKVRGWVSLRKKRFDQRKTHRFYPCPSCKQMTRVPVGKGKISIQCPACQTSFIRKS